MQRKGIEVKAITMDLTKEGEFVDTWTVAPEKVTAMMRNRYGQYPVSDTVRVKFYDGQGEIQLETSYELYQDGREAPKQPSPANAPNLLAGVGTPHDLGALVEQKVQQLRQQDELERLRSEHGELKDRNFQLQEQVESLEAQVEAKSNLEYYSKVAGDLLPGIAKAFEKTSLGPALSGMAGGGTTDDQSTVLSSTKDLVKVLSEDQLSAFYMLILELQSNPAFIPAIYQNAFGHE